MIEPLQKEELILKINKKREEMISAAGSKSYTSNEVVKYSQELDELLNQFQEMEWGHRSATPFTKLVTRVATWGFSQQTQHAAADH
ncbi:aspartyl-phosphate phosphatase Spo0E family protein [Bacillus sp. FJAT-42376]|uniref:aspartyl-phosphate phosphatase Spo0E family protein n=1 Tax=Bacillus sp. FJAT-42376 TaxID=2014076 RepID=UPI000F4EF450|nr:aspartyl-phosphate phosphatase Spo0E family protein [Bacillus sp. FJAT-42376]AZB42536.1 aspartyl-phosphate phosphatase Spo0E family protein [Bacillus sp. FJAT-42376]